MRTDGRTDMELSVAFRNFANTPNKITMFNQNAPITNTITSLTLAARLSIAYLSRARISDSENRRVSFLRNMTIHSAYGVNIHKT
jgi:hypothetical protein